MGFVLTLAIVVAKARFRSFIFAMEDLAAFRWELLPVLLGLVGGFYLGWRRPRALPWATACGLGGLLLGILLGPLLGGLFWHDEAGHWAGAVITGALFMLGGIIASLQIRKVPRHPLITAVFSVAILLGLAGFGLFGVSNLLNVNPLEFPKPPHVPVPDAPKVDAVLFLLGDGGELTDRSPLLRALGADIERWSAALKRDSAVSVAYLGDIVYPNGVRNRDDPGFPQDSLRLWKQIDLVGGAEATKHATLGFFVTGNHDWGNHSGDAGFDRIVNLGEQIRKARLSGHYVSLLPAAGDPGPAVRDLRRNVRIAFFDTHWFLQERSRDQRALFFDRLSKALSTSRDREVILIAHHPYESAGPHGAVVSGDNTLGIAYVLKEAGALVQDLNSPPYEELLSGLRRTFQQTGKPPLIYAGGHDHSLQVLTGANDFDPRFSLVSGAGSKMTPLEMGPGLVWGGEQPGYMMLVFRKDDGVDLFVVGGDAKYLTCNGTDAEVAGCMTDGANAFKIVYSASLLGPAKEPRGLEAPVSDTTAPGTPWWTEEGPVADTRPMVPVADSLQPAPVAVPTRALLEGVDSVSTTPGRTYPAGSIRRFFAGDLNRNLWGVTITLPVLDLDKVGKGLTPEHAIGGKQTVGLRFMGGDGLEYDFRPVVKQATQVIPKWLPQKLGRAVVDDQMAAMFPLSALMVSRLSEALEIAAPHPVAVVMPNDARLGQFRAVFAGRVGMLTVHEDERKGGGPGFGGYTMIVSSDSLYREVTTNPKSTIDDRYFLRARLLDALVGDWDRHSDQWRWGRRRIGDSTVWRAIPRDRDWAFARIDGMTAIVSRLVFPNYVGFSNQVPSPRRLARSGERIDHRVLNRLERIPFLDVVNEVQTLLTDSVLAAAIEALPPPYLELERDRLLIGLKARRDQLGAYGQAYYTRLAGTVNVYGFDQSQDFVEFQRISKERVRVTLRTGTATGPIRYERLLDGRETKTVKLFIDPAQDQVIGNKDLPFKVEILPNGDLP